MFSQQWPKSTPPSSSKPPLLKSLFYIHTLQNLSCRVDLAMVVLKYFWQYCTFFCLLFRYHRVTHFWGIIRPVRNTICSAGWLAILIFQRHENKNKTLTRNTFPLPELIQNCTERKYNEQFKNYFRKKNWTEKKKKKKDERQKRRKKKIPKTK